jgi:glutamate decarboxylase
MVAEHSGKRDPDESIEPLYGSRYALAPIPKHRLPAGEMPAATAARLVRDELTLDGNPTLNLASFVTTWMEPEAVALVAETADKNFADADEYPRTGELEARCLHMLADLFHAPRSERGGLGAATVGSTEAIALAGLAFKRRWQARRRAAGRPTDAPNFVIGHNDQVAWEKLARYFEIEPRFVPVSHDRFVIDVDQALARIDANTICVVGILGSTFTGEYEPIAELHDALADREQRTGQHVPMHVDAASGGFVAPFTDPDLRWDFRLPLVKSINVSGHKYGLVYPGIGWVLWREKADLPADLVFHINYLGADQPTLSLNFSRGSSQIIAQYYNLIRLGRGGYTRIMQGLMSTADYLAQAVKGTGHFQLVGQRNGLPLVCFRLTGERQYDEHDVARTLRGSGWIVPAYTLPPDAQDLTVLRVVVRESFSRDLADLLAADLTRVVAELDARPPGGHDHQPKTRGVC